jgi:hypothetical protein
VIRIVILKQLDSACNRLIFKKFAGGRNQTINRTAGVCNMVGIETGNSERFGTRIIFRFTQARIPLAHRVRQPGVTC